MPLISVCMTELVLIWITTHSSASARGAGKDKTAKVILLHWIAISG